MIRGKCYEYVDNLSMVEFEELESWVNDPCYDCPVSDPEIKRKLGEFVIDPGSPLFVALLADMYDKLLELEATIERLKMLNRLRDV